MRLVKKVGLLLALTALSSQCLYAKPAVTNKKPASATAETGILATVAAIDKNEILVSAVALHKESDSDVKDFAKMMVDMHSDNLAQILEMANQLHATSLTSTTASALLAQNAKDLLKLGGLKEKEFAKAYIDAMVTGHQAALNLIDQHLMKEAKAEEIKKFLTDTRAAVAQHLDAAKKIQKDM